MTDFKQKKLFRIVLHSTVFFLALIIINGAAFLHYHIDADGRLIVHSHLSRASGDSMNNKTGPAKHQHNNIEYYILNSISDINNYCLFSPVVYNLHIIEQPIDLPAFSATPSVDLLCSTATRAPPLG